MIRINPTKPPRVLPEHAAFHVLGTLDHPERVQAVVHGYNGAAPAIGNDLVTRTKVLTHLETILRGQIGDTIRDGSRGAGPFDINPTKAVSMQGNLQTAVSRSAALDALETLQKHALPKSAIEAALRSDHPAANLDALLAIAKQSPEAMQSFKANLHAALQDAIKANGDDYSWSHIMNKAIDTKGRTLPAYLESDGVISAVQRQSWEKLADKLQSRLRAQDQAHADKISLTNMSAVSMPTPMTRARRRTIACVPFFCGATSSL
jgi:hypothetical protein